MANRGLHGINTDDSNESKIVDSVFSGQNSQNSQKDDNNLDTKISSIIKSTYPWINLREDKLLMWIIYTIWDVGFTRAPYIEVVYRLLVNEKLLFPTNRSVRGTIRQMCAKGVMKCKIETFLTYDNKGLLRSESKHKVLEVSEKFMTCCIKAIAYG